MDVCRPQLLWLNGSCYRINCQNGSERDNNVDFYSGDVADEYDDEIGCAMEDTPEINDCQYEIDEDDSGRFSVSIFHHTNICSYLGLYLARNMM